MSRPLRVFCRKSAGKTCGKTDVWKPTLESGRCGICRIQLCPVHTRCVFRRQNNAAGVRKIRCEMDIPLRAFSPSAKNCGRPLRMLFFHHGGLEKRTGGNGIAFRPKKLRFTARISTFLSEYGYSRAGGKSVVSLKYVFHRSTFSAVP